MIKERLQDTGLYEATNWEHPKFAMLKTAGSGLSPNPEHPIIEQFGAFTKIAHGHHILMRSVDIVDELLDLTNSKLQEMI